MAIIPALGEQLLARSFWQAAGALKWERIVVAQHCFDARFAARRKATVYLRKIPNVLSGGPSSSVFATMVHRRVAG